jgi:hypothetical protein
MYKNRVGEFQPSQLVLGFYTFRELDTCMPGAGRSGSPAVRFIGATVALIAIVEYLIFGWSFNGSKTTVTTILGIIVAVSAIGWTVYSRVYSDKGLLR